MTAAALALGGMAGCGFTKTGNSCATGLGLSAAGYRGTSLTDGQWSLTFDGGPGETAGALGNYLYANGVQATFFVGGNAVAAHTDVLATLKAQGHLVGNRGYSGVSLAEALDPVTEVRKTDELILPYVTGDMFLLRNPLGSLTDAAALQLNDAGLTRYVGHVGWDIGDQTAGFQVDTDCWAAGMTADQCTAGYLSAAAAVKHGIILLHATADQSLALIQELLPKLKQAAGFTGFVRLDAVPDLQVVLVQSGGTPGTVGGDAACNEY